MSDGGLTAVQYVEEVTFGETPASPMQRLAALTSESLKLTTGTNMPEIIRGDYIKPRINRTSLSGEGSLEFELSYGDLDDFMEGAARNDWSAPVSVTDSDIGFVAASQTISSGGHWVIDGIVPGSVVRISGATNAENNGYHYVTEVTATELTVVGSALVDEVAGATITVENDGFLSNGTVKKSYTIEKLFDDLTLDHYEIFRGMRVGEFTVNHAAGSDVTASVAFTGVGMDIDSASAGNGTVNPPVEEPLMQGVSDVMGITEGGVLIQGTNCVSQLDFTIGGGTRPIQCLGELGAGAINLNSFEVTGVLNVYNADEVGAFVQKYVDFVPTSLVFRDIDEEGQGYAFAFPRTKYTDSARNSGGANSDVVANLTWGAELDPVTDILFGITRFDAPA